MIPKTVGAWIGGSGTWGMNTLDFVNHGVDEVVFIEPVETPFGMSASPHLLSINGNKVLHFTMHGWADDGSGRSIPTWERAKQVAWILQQAGVSWAVVDASVGGVAHPETGAPLAPWSVVITDDLISGFEPDSFPPILNPENPYPRLREPLCSSVRSQLYQAALEESKFSVSPHGVYYCTKTGRFETPAEIRAIRMLGGHIVGQTLYYEVVLLAQLGIHFGSLNIVSNYAEGNQHWVGDDSPRAMHDFYVECAPVVASTMVAAIDSIFRDGIDECGCGKHSLSGMDIFPVDYK